MMQVAMEDLDSEGEGPWHLPGVYESIRSDKLLIKVSERCGKDEGFELFEYLVPVITLISQKPRIFWKKYWKRDCQPRPVFLSLTLFFNLL